MLFFAFVAIIIALGMFFATASYDSSIGFVIKDRDKYLSIISTAELNGNIDHNAKVKSVLYNTDYEKYYITYTFNNGSGEPIDGYSFCVYSTYDSAPKAFNAVSNNYISVAYDSTDSTADSIPVDYKNFKLEDDGQYVKMVESKKLFGALAYIISIISAGLIAYAIVLRCKLPKATEEEINKVKKSSGEISSLTESTPKKYIICRYCGNKILAATCKCPNCGASQNEEVEE